MFSENREFKFWAALREAKKNRFKNGDVNEKPVPGWEGSTGEPVSKH